MRKPIHSRGFTLLELLVGAAVGAVVLLGISLTFISQAQQYQAHASRRGVQANARQALAFMESTLRMAGYGVDPDRAIIPYDSFNAGADAQDEGYPDAFVVHWRDPLFRRNVTALNATTLTVDSPPTPTEPIRRGQILMVICSPGSGGSDQSVESNPPHVFVTVGAYVANPQVDIPLDPTPANAAPNSPLGAPGRLFHEQTTPGFTHACFNSPIRPQVVLINRAAFYVDLFDDDGNPATPERTPYLMMHQGLDNPSATSALGDGVIDRNDAVPVAEGIEQLQVAYMLDTVDTNPPIILGVDTPMGPNHYGENWENIKPGPTELPRGWFFNAGYPTRPFTDQDMLTKRQDDHPANIRQVRITLSSRSSVPDPQIVGDNLMKRRDGSDYPDGTPLANGAVPWRHWENLEVPTPDFTPSGGHFYRAILRQSISPKNLQMSRQFAPVNQGGG
ncbi:PilW family protein [Hyalangium versicolor]|uniref:PilW family protein n=1 Tax=Hyalangium versicolor TaxID=2861190 RepID=UPI001CCAA258|nr:prepilin-type N-terminal cleavage/methylation domain-containing protein [Hyalangium versicolor]